jgi:hypothetical protein
MDVSKKPKNTLFHTEFLLGIAVWNIYMELSAVAWIPRAPRMIKKAEGSRRRRRRWRRWRRREATTAAVVLVIAAVELQSVAAAASPPHQSKSLPAQINHLNLLATHSHPLVK